MVSFFYTMELPNGHANDKLPGSQCLNILNLTVGRDWGGPRECDVTLHIYKSYLLSSYFTF